jgi:8-oxo-dGTP diphosphatase
MDDRPRIGIAVFIINENNEVLLGLRNSTLGNNTWAPPGGKLDKFESFENCIIREAKEETNLDIEELNFIGITNDIMKDNDCHYVTLFFSANKYKGKVQRMEPEKCLEWKWFNPKDLPKNLFIPFKNFIDGNFIS